jgi:hypothetical protein
MSTAVVDTQAGSRPTLLAALDEVEAAAVLGVHPRTLANWRCTGKGPRYIAVGRRRVYRPEDLSRFMEVHAVEPGS